MVVEKIFRPWNLVSSRNDGVIMSKKRPYTTQLQVFLSFGYLNDLILHSLIILNWSDRFPCRSKTHYTNPSYFFYNSNCYGKFFFFCDFFSFHSLFYSFFHSFFRSFVHLFFHSSFHSFLSVFSFLPQLRVHFQLACFLYKASHFIEKIFNQLLSVFARFHGLCPILTDIARFSGFVWFCPILSDFVRLCQIFSFCQIMPDF